MPDRYDVVIIGGGVVGCFLARYLSRYALQILLIEKEADIGMGASSANSGIIHPGHDPIPGTLKATMNLAANPMWDQIAAELQIPFERRGCYVVGVGPEEVPILESMLERGCKNGVPGIAIISAEKMRRDEPKINPEVSAALWMPTGAIVDPFAATVAAAENAVQNGVTVLLETEFEDFLMDGRRIIGVKTNRGEFESRWVVNAAGLYADEVMHKAHIRPDFKVTPRKGEYCVFDQAEVNIQTVLFPVPSETSKGILVLKTMHGNTMMGPNSNPCNDKEDRSVTAEGIAEIWKGAAKLVPGLNMSGVIAGFAGLRASGNAPCRHAAISYGHDFIIEIAEEVTGLVNIGGIESPGLTAAPAIALRVIELLKDAGELLQEKPQWNPLRPARPHFRNLSREEQTRLIQKDPRYGRVICRCEIVTEGEIVAEIHAPIPALTYDAIKRRTWLGAGRCLGSFDVPRVVAILARERGISQLEVTKKGEASRFLVRETKAVEV